MAEQRPPDEQGGGDDALAREQADAAAAEAGAIGGRGGADGLDEAERPIAEGGGGVAEGFEQAEKDLIESAERGQERDPAADAGEPEANPDPATHGEADTAVSEDQPDGGGRA